VPVAVQNQFVNDARICGILNQTEVETICVSKNTIGVIMELKKKKLLPNLKNLICYDKPEGEFCTMSESVGVQIYTYQQLVTEGG
jgi:hypothetical protein